MKQVSFEEYEAFRKAFPEPLRSSVATIAEPPVFYLETMDGTIVAKTVDARHYGDGITYWILDD